MASTKPEKSAGGPSTHDRTDLEEIHPGLVTNGSVVLHRFGTTPTYPIWRSKLIGPERGQLRASAVPTNPGISDKFRLVISHRNPSALFGSGLIDRIDASAIEAEEALQKKYKGTVHGRAARQKDGRIGRFGWKAQVPTLRDFVLNACAVELGLETPTHHQIPDPFGFGDKASHVDLSAQDCDDLIAYVGAIPEPVASEPRGHLKGLALFKLIGCSDCHKPDMAGVEGLYSDLLLHDMGSGLSDSGMYYGDDNGTPSPGTPKPGEWKTPPLWGVADSAPYLHDGRAETLTAAIAAHDGEAATSRAEFGQLPSEQRGRVIRFLKSLRGPKPDRAAPRVRRRA